MSFNNHSDLEGQHSFFSASQGAWVNYDDDKLIDRYRTVRSAAHGTRLHEFAAEAITLGIPLRGTQTLAKYVNDAIGYRMSPEVVLYYSPIAFSTVDAISFRKNKLRIHDLKTGVTKASIRQLEIYTAYFCLEYGFSPTDLETWLRIYQNDEIYEQQPDNEFVRHIMDRIITGTKLLTDLQAQGEL